MATKVKDLVIGKTYKIGGLFPKVGVFKGYDKEAGSFDFEIDNPRPYVTVDGVVPLSFDLDEELEEIN